MPRVERYDRVVADQGTTQAGFRAAEYGEGLGPGLISAGRGVAAYQQAEEAIAEIRAEDEARALDLEHMEFTSGLRRRVRNARGMAATTAFSEAEAELKTFESNLLGRTSNRLARNMLQRTTSNRSVQERANWNDYAFGQEREAGDQAIEARSSRFREDALDHPVGSQEATVALESGLNELRQLSVRQGWDRGRLEEQTLRYRSSFHASRVDQLYAAERPEEAQAYIDSNRGEMTAADEASAVRTIRGELLTNRVEEDVAAAEGSIYADAPSTGTGGEAVPTGNSSTASRGDRNNNPGNLVDGSFARRQAGYRGSDGRFAQFDTREQGIAAQESLLRNNYLNQPRTVRQILDRYTPASDPGNSPAARENYISFLHRRLGVGPNETLSPADTPRLAAAIREFETGATDGEGRPTTRPPDAVAPPPGEARWNSPVRINTRTVSGGEYGASRDYGSHRAVDMAGPEGTPLYPMGHGTVRAITRSQNGGNILEIEYAGGWRSKYMHLQDGSTANLRVGQEVGPDDRVALMGNTGRSSGPHLHLEVLDPQGNKVDPNTIIGSRAQMPSPVSGRRIDIGRAEDYARRRVESGEWSRTRARMFTDAVRQRAGQELQFRAAEEQDAERQFNQWLDGRDSTIPPQWNEVPAEIARRLPPGSETQVRSRRQNYDDEQTRLAQTVNEVRANGDPALQLELLSESDPNAFVSLITTRGDALRQLVTPQEWSRYQITAERLTRNAGASPSEIMGMIRTLMPDDMGLPAAPRVARGGQQEATRQRSLEVDRDRVALMRAVQDRLRTQQGVRAPTAADIQAAIASETTPVRGPMGLPVPRYRLQAIGYQGQIQVDIPNSALPAIREVLRRSGIPDTPYNQAQEYIRNRSIYSR